MEINPAYKKKLEKIFRFSYEDIYLWLENAFDLIKSNSIINGFVKAGYIDQAEIENN